MAEHTERMGLAMADFISTTKPEMLTWTNWVPTASSARSALELVAECVNANRLFAALLRGESPEKPDDLTLTAEEAQTQIVASSRELADAMRLVEDSAFEKLFEHPVRGEISGKILMMGAYRNMAYHAGQINFIQILSGDNVFHLPPTWLK